MASLNHGEHGGHGEPLMRTAIPVFSVFPVANFMLKLLNS
jgi:hypothetical protein